jgi:filamentous hemagglutinin family protein
MNNAIAGHWGWQLLASVLMVGDVIALSENCALGQVVGDTTLGAESSLVTSPTPGGFQIDGGATRGTNLFHSFRDFSVPTNGFAYFNNALDIQNIISRVTGASLSNIDGQIAANGTANLFLINPNGIVFGPNASLNIGGSFFASTANSLVFDNGYQFSATNPQAPPLLTINVPLGLQYGATPGRIVNQSIANGNGLQVQPGRTLGLVGGDVDLEGGILSAPDGRIELGSVAGNSRVNLIPTSTGYTLGYEGIENFQDIRLTQRAIVVTDTNVGGGNIQVQGRNVALTDGSTIETFTSGAGRGGNLIVNASDSVQVIGESADGQISSSLFAITSGTGDAGELRINTRALLIKDGAQVSAGTSGVGNGGSLIINASDSVQVIGHSVNSQYRSSSVGAISGNTATGDAGDIRITTGQLVVRDGAMVSTNTLGVGKGGNLIINASDSVQVIATSNGVSFLSASTFGTGDAGDITITTPWLLIKDGAAVAATTSSAAKGGNVTINASDSVQVIGTSADGQLASMLTTGTLGTGDAGEIKITTGQLLVRDGGNINMNTSDAGKGGSLIINASDWVRVIGTSADGRLPSMLTTATLGTGDAGEVKIATGQLLIQDGAQVGASTLGAGKGGSLIVNASDSVQVIGISNGGSGLFAITTGTGDAGDMTITTPRLLIKDGGGVNASTGGAGKGGSLIINASDWVQVIGLSSDGQRFSGLVAQANRGSTGDAGNLTITTGQLLVRDGAQISTGTLGAGKGGNLTVQASQGVQVIGHSADGQVSSGLFAQTSRGSTGDAGNLTITTGPLLLKDGAQVSASTLGAGKGGSLIVNASDWVQVIGHSADGQVSSGLFAQTEGTGDAGNLTITTEQLLISGGAGVSASTFGTGNGGDLIVHASEGVQVIGHSADGRFGSSLSAATYGKGDGGNLTITTGQLLVRDGSQVDVGTDGAGKGGDLIIHASESVQVIGTTVDGKFPSGLFASAVNGGIAGDLIIETRQMSVRDGAGVTVSSLRGQAGNLTITAEDLSLNQGTISAQTARKGGANITLQGLDLLRMDNESLISATAVEDAKGGNVTIDSTLIVATPPKDLEGSDIIANADRGNGGEVNITTQGLFGIEFRPQRTPKNDITVTSTYGVAGIVQVNGPDVDPSRGLAQLPTNFVDASSQIDRRCTSGATQRSSLTITGRGGLPPNPNDVLQAESVITNWVTLDPSLDNRSSNDTSTTPSAAQTPTIIEAQGWMYDPNGEVILTATAANVTLHSPMPTPGTCSSF